MTDVGHSFTLTSRPLPYLEIGERSIPISPVQYRILSALQRSGQRFVNHDGILDAIAKGRALETTTVTVNISKLRKILADTPITIESAYGMGYRLAENDGTVKVARKWGTKKTAPRKVTSKPIAAPKPEVIRLPTEIKRKYPPAPYTPRTCQWLEGEPRDRDFCGKPVRPNSSYCDAHHARCYERPSDVGEGRAA